MPDHEPAYTYLVQVYDPVDRQYKDTVASAETARYSGTANDLARDVLGGVTAPFNALNGTTTSGDLRVAVWEGDLTGNPELRTADTAAAIAYGG